ncbi:MAG: HAD family hydrolase [Hyphomicrobiaceae bacterium]
MAIRGVLFDKDGTIIDFHLSWSPINRAAALHAAGGDVTLANRLLSHGGQDPETDRCLPGTPLAQGTAKEIAAVFSEVIGSSRYAALADDIDRIFEEGGKTHSVLVPGAVETLRWLRGRGIPIGVATNDSMLGIETSLARHDVLPHFAFLAGYDSGHGAKPGPGMVTAFCRSQGLAPEEVCVVGDSINDLRMASAGGAGLKIGVLTGPSAPADLEGFADLILGSIAEMPASEDFTRCLA